jgi:hypothetical protein
MKKLAAAGVVAVLVALFAVLRSGHLKLAKPGASTAGSRR